MSPSRQERFYAALVHLLTASGALFGFLALLSAARGAFEESFIWLGVAFIVDGLDGPLARRFEVARVLPRFSGEDLDQIIDYLTYVTVPAFMLASSGLLPSGLEVAAAGIVMLVSLYHFADRDSKTGDGYFVGFPAIWNVVVLYLFVVPVAKEAALAIVLGCAVLTFVPLKWVHPVRVRRIRWLTALLTVAWAIAAVTAVLTRFPGPRAVQAVFLIVLAYGIGVGLWAGMARKAPGKGAE